MENSLAVPLNVERGVTILSSNSTPRYISKKNENICLHNNLYRDVHEILFMKAKRWKQYKCHSIYKCVNKMWYMHAMKSYLALKEMKF